MLLLESRSMGLTGEEGGIAERNFGGGVAGAVTLIWPFPRVDGDAGLAIGVEASASRSTELALGVLNVLVP